MTNSGVRVWNLQQLSRNFAFSIDDDVISRQDEKGIQLSDSNKINIWRELLLQSLCIAIFCLFQKTAEQALAVWTQQPRKLMVTIRNMTSLLITKDRVSRKRLQSWEPVQFVMVISSRNGTLSRWRLLRLSSPLRNRQLMILRIIKVISWKFAVSLTLTLWQNALQYAGRNVIFQMTCRKVFECATPSCVCISEISLANPPICYCAKSLLFTLTLDFIICFSPLYTFEKILQSLFFMA